MPNDLICKVSDNLSVCGLQSVNDPEIFMGYGFKAHLQLVEGFPEWIMKFTSVKTLCFDDCVSIPQTVLDEAMSWIKPFYFKGQRILISCAAGESRSVSIAICATSLFESMEFYDACKVVFKAIPRAYPHPNPLVSVGKYCKASLHKKQLRNIYSLVSFPPPFPWQEEELDNALSQQLKVKRYNP